jgi:gamma-glutamyltranspeptidase / glutathione hydrolase / leukotriene-C4 hydrolase
MNFEGLKSVFAPNGKLLTEGEALLQPALAQTLTLIAEKGAAEYYTGSIAENIVADVAAAGGILSMDDLAWFYNNGIKVRQPLSTFFQGFEIIGAAPPFGGVCNALALNLLEGFNLPLLGSASDLAQHWLVEALKFAFSDRMAEGDPDFEPMEQVIEAMTSKKHASMLRQRFNASSTLPFSYYLDLVGGSPVDDKGTSHLSIIDQQGMAVALTTTVNTAFGSKILSPLTGIVMNDEMADFSSPNTTNVFGLPPTEANFIQPYKKYARKRTHAHTQTHKHTHTHIQQLISITKSNP